MQEKLLRAVVKITLIFLFGWGSVLSQTHAQSSIAPLRPSYLDSLDAVVSKKGFSALYKAGVGQFLPEEDNEIAQYYTDLLENCRKEGRSQLANDIGLRLVRFLQIEDDSLAAIQAKDNLQYIGTLADGAPKFEMDNLYWLGRSYWELDLNQEAIAAYKKSLALSRTLGDQLRELNCLKYLGICYKYIGEEAIGLAYLEMMSIVNDAYYEEDPRRLAINLTSFASRIPKSPEYLDLAIEKDLRIVDKLEQLAEPHRQRSYLSALNRLNGSYIDANQYERAAESLSKTLGVLQKRGDSLYLDDILENKGVLFKRLSRFDSALHYYEQTYALRLLESKEKSEDLNYSLHNLGEVHDSLEQYETAAKFYQLALQQALMDFDELDPAVTPTNITEENLNTTYFDLIKDLDNKGLLFFKWYKRNGNKKHLQIAFETYQFAIEVIYKRRMELLGESSKIVWQKDLFPVFERALTVLESTQEKQLSIGNYHSIAYEWMEKSKALILLESLIQQQLAKTPQANDSLFLQIGNIQKALVEVQNQIARNGLNNDYQLEKLGLQIDLWETELLLKSDKDLLNAEVLEKEASNLVGLKKNTLNDKQVLLEFFYGEKHLFALLTDSKKTHFFKINRAKELSNEILKLRNALIQKDKSEILKQHAYNIANALFLNTIKTKFWKSKEELLIVPDGLLSILPFEILTSPLKEDNFLIDEFAISYAFSAATLEIQKSRQKFKNRILFTGMAPDFSGPKVENNSRLCNQNQLAPLLENGKEVKEIKALLGGRIVEKNEATKDYFLEEAVNSRVLHLATHACLDDQDPTQSKIYFTDNHLYAHELNATSLSSEMVVLSACETGVGEYQRGEGIMSLARNFAKAGAPSLTLSYWSVSDQSTAELMGYYYEYLKAGKTKHEALRQAKLEYLNNQESVERMHPYYWAAFVHFGDYDVIDLEGRNFDGIYVFLSLFISFALIRYFLRGRK